MVRKFFDPFFTTKNKDGGLGLGLSSYYKIIKDYGGELKVKSKKGDWTEFSFNLPCVKIEGLGSINNKKSSYQLKLQGEKGC